MTATERVYRQGSENIASMDDENVYGKVFHQMSFKQAIDYGIICDYKILTVAVSGYEIENLMAEHTDITAQLSNQKVETDTHNLAAGIAIEKVFEKHKIKHALSFHRSIKRAEDFIKQQDAFSGKLGSKLYIENRTISSKFSAGQRSQLLKGFTASERSLISNARCLTEGVDIPSIDCVAFVDPKQSTVDIVQAAGRAMRQSKETGKTHGFIILPIIIPKGQNLAEFAESTDFSAITRIITSLSTQDERIVEQLRIRKIGQPPNPNDIIVIDPDIIEIMDVNFKTFYNSLNLKIWASVGKANWRPLNELKEYISTFNFKSVREYRDWSKSEDKSPDIPTNPNEIYKHNGWTTWGEFLGNGTVAPQNLVFKSFTEAKNYAHLLKLKTQKEWREWAYSSKRPNDIPATPAQVYRDDGWVDIGDWLGTGNKASRFRSYRSFDEAKLFIKKLNFKTVKEYRAWARSSKRPIDIPAKPDRVYRDKGWINFNDWLSKPDKIPFKSFIEARKFAQSLEFKTRKEWLEFTKSSEKPKDIPAAPDIVYADKGWIGIGDWLGTGAVAAHKRTYPSYNEARAIVHKAKIKSHDEWLLWCKTKRPLNVHSKPFDYYKNNGWISWSDWFGR